MVTYRNQGERQMRPAMRFLEIADLLIWAFRDQQAMAVMAREAMRPGAFPVSGTQALMRTLELGTRVDGGGPGADHIHPDAIEVWVAVANLEPEMAGLMALHARAGSEPEWPGDIRFRWLARRDTRGRTVVDYVDGDARIGKYTPVRLIPTWETVELIVWSYNTWIEGLALVADRLSGRLANHEVVICDRCSWNV